jgi:hypothetical protein
VEAMDAVMADQSAYSLTYACLKKLLNAKEV